MENQKKRVLAYSLAKEISNEELARVSGGSTHITTTPTFKSTGDPNRQLQMSHDVQVDW